MGSAGDERSHQGRIRLSTGMIGGTSGQAMRETWPQRSFVGEQSAPIGPKLGYVSIHEDCDLRVGYG
jgi:hypothetical protein